MDDARGTKKKGGTFSYKIDGILAEDQKYLGSPRYAGSAVNAEAAGQYTLSVSFPNFSKAGNYTIEYVDDTDFVIRSTSAN